MTTDANFEFRKTAVLRCTSDNPGSKVYWETSNGTRVVALNPHKPARYEEGANGSLIIWKPSKLSMNKKLSLKGIQCASFFF